MTHAALSPLIGSEFEKFLCAPIGEDRNGTMLSVLSALARLNVDPWQEATSLARMPSEAAAVRLIALIDALPKEPASALPSKTTAADLVALLPKGKPSNVRPPNRTFEANGLRQTQILVAFGAFAIVMLIVFAISALFSPGPGSRANPLTPRSTDATTALPRKFGP